MAKSKRHPGGAAGMLVDQVEREGPAKREANLQLLRDQVRAHHEAGNAMHEIIFKDALDYLEG